MTIDDMLKNKLGSLKFCGLKSIPIVFARGEKKLNRTTSKNKQKNI